MVEAESEKFAPSGGRVTGALGLLIAAGFVVVGVVYRDEVPLVVVAGAVVAGVLMWASMLRPRVLVAEGHLVLRNMVETIHIPLAAIEDLSVRQVLAVRTAARRYVSPGVGRSLRHAFRRAGPERPTEATRPALGPAFGGAAPSQLEPGMPYADWVEHRLRDLIDEDRHRRGVRAYSEEAEALAADVRREPAWPEIAALALSVLFLVAVIVL